MATLDKLGKYDVTEVLGKGAMGVVYRAFDPNIRRTVALKTIRKELIDDDDRAATMLARFKNEAQAAGRLSHPGIVSVYEYGEEGDLAYIAMEYVQGNPLREYFNRGTRFEDRDETRQVGARRVLRDRGDERLAAFGEGSAHG